MKKGSSKITVLALAVLLLALCSGCGTQKIDPTGTYVFEETVSGSSGRSDFTMVTWNVTFNSDGTYIYYYDTVSGGGGSSGPSETTTTRYSFEGTYTVEGEIVHTETPNRAYSKVVLVEDADGNPVAEDPENPRVERDENVFAILTSNFFNDDQSCDWMLDTEKGTATPTRYEAPMSNRDNNDVTN